VKAGGVWTNGNSSTTLYDFGIPVAQLNLLNAAFPFANLGSGNSGFIGGGQAGYNYQWGSAVLGIETDFDGSSLSRHRSFIGAPFLNPLIRNNTDFFTANGSTSLAWLGSTRARLGWVATPDNSLLIYGTGGVAYSSGHANLRPRLVNSASKSLCPSARNTTASPSISASSAGSRSLRRAEQRLRQNAATSTRTIGGGLTRRRKRFSKFAPTGWARAPWHSASVIDLLGNLSKARKRC
jgi:outer membrane immunogenic protein